jgi:prephenate dehydrogenase
MIPRRIAIIGPGLIGTSVALAARRAWPAVTLAVFDRGDSLAAVPPADTIVIATPVDVTIEILTHEAPHFGDALILDTGSTKGAIVAAARAAGLHSFVGGHPMAGGASSGPRDARANLFDGKPWFIVPADVVGSTVARAEHFVAALGAIPVVMKDDGGAAHDRLVAALSHLPQVVASVLMNVVGDTVGAQDLQWAGAGLRDTTRLAASASLMWESVLASNAAELRPLLIAVATELAQLADRLDNAHEVRRVFTAANAYRGRLT